MPTIVVDNKSHVLASEEGDSLYDILLAAQERLWTDGDSIESVTVDGSPIEKLDEEALAMNPGSDARIEVKLGPAAARPEVKDTVDEAAAYLEKLSEGFKAVAIEIRKGGNESFEEVGHGLRGLSTVLTLIESLLTYPGVPESIRKDTSGYLSELMEKSTDLAEAQENDDNILIADLLEYEYVEAVEQLHELLKQLKPYIG